MSFITLLKSMGPKPTDKQQKKLSDALSKMTILDLSYENLSDVDMNNLLLSLSSNTTLTILNLCGNGFRVGALEAKIMWNLVRIIEYHPTLKQLNLAHNQIKEEDIKRFAAALHLTKLDCLQLEGMLSPAALSELFFTIAECENKVFTSEFFGPNFFKNLSIGDKNRFLEALKENKVSVKMKAIRDPILFLLRDMGENPTTEQRRALVDALSEITSLDLSCQKLTAENIFNLAKALESNSSIEGLNLSANEFCELDEKGDMTIKHTMAMLSLAKMIKSNNFLMNLYLRNNNINDEGLAILADALKQNRTLITLHLGQNDQAAVTREGLSGLLSVIAHSTHRVFPPTFLDMILLNQFPDLRDNYYNNVYKKNEYRVKRREAQESAQQEEPGLPAELELREEIEKCLDSAQDLVQSVRDAAMAVGSKPVITRAKGTMPDGSTYSEIKYSATTETVYQTKKTASRKK